LEFGRAGNNARMGIAVSLIITAIGLILALAVHPANPGSVDPNTIGWILFVVGIVGLVLDLLLWSPIGPAYMRRRVYSTGPAYPATTTPAGYPPRRRTVVEEDDVAPGPPGY
jgi:hypothetical protein